MNFDLADFGRAWLAVSTAAGKDRHDPPVCRAVQVVKYRHGITLASTDRELVLRSFVPCIGGPAMTWPDEAPEVAAIAIDADGRARHLCSYAVSLAARSDRDDEADRPCVRLQLGVKASPVGGSGAEPIPMLAPRFVTIEVDGLERVKLRTYDGEFPPVHPLFDRFTPAPASVVALDGPRTERVLKAAGYFSVPVGMRLGGDGRPARLDFPGSEPVLEGMLMPTRWDFDRDTVQMAPEDGPDPILDGDDGPADELGTPPLSAVPDADDDDPGY